MKKSAMIFTIIITILVTASVVWALTSIPISSPSGKNEISEEMQALQTTNQELLEQTKELTDERNLLQARLEEIDESKDEITRQPKSGWNQYFPEHNTTTLEGETTATVQELLGVPAIKIRSTAFSTEFNREIWIFMPYEQDATGLYLYFKGDKLWQSQLNEFNGLYNSGLLQYESFWLN